MSLLLTLGAVGLNLLTAPTIQDPPPRLQAVRTERAPVIDGHPDEQVWAAAARIDGLTQVEPVEGGAPAVATEVLLLYDDSHLYLAFRCAEPDPSAIVQTRLRRDESPGNDDRVEWLIETFRGTKNAYRFTLTAAGARADALIAVNGFRVNPYWDGTWEGRTAIGPDGWTGEVAIPFSTIAFDPSGEWGFNLQRFRGRDRTLDRWAAASRQFSFENVKASGTLEGLTGLQQGAGLELRPFFKASASHDAANDDDLLGQLGGDLNWRITPSLTAGLTFRTDFAETEVDDSVINVSRFPTFFPEKRDFFLEDASLFDFGPFKTSPADAPDLVPYHSRTIGLVRGEEIPIDFGARLTGNAGPLGLAFLGVGSGEGFSGSGPAAVAVPDGELAVFRPTFRASRELQVGGFFTTGDPSSEQHASTVGGDARFFSNQLLDGFFGVNSWFMASSDGVTDTNDVAYGGQAYVQTDDWNFHLEGMAIGGDFRPALGFVRRRGIHRNTAVVRWRPRPEDSSWIRNFDFRLAPRVYRDLSEDLESYTVPFRFFGLDTHAGDRVFLTAYAEGDRPDAGFAPAPGSLVPAGDHDWLRGGIGLTSSTSRAVQGMVELRDGDWYDGQMREWITGLSWRPSARFLLQGLYLQNEGSMPGGDFTLRVEQLKVDWTPTADLSWQNLLQSENLGRSFDAQSRLRWLLEDGRELFLVFGSNWIDDTRSLAPTRGALALKVVYSVRF